MQSATDAQAPAILAVLAERTPVLVRLFRAGMIGAPELVAGWRVGAGLDAQDLDR